MELTSDGIQDRADEQRAEQSLGHGAQGVYAVTPGRDDDIFPFQKGFYIFHSCVDAIFVHRSFVSVVIIKCVIHHKREIRYFHVRTEFRQLAHFLLQIVGHIDSRFPLADQRTFVGGTDINCDHKQYNRQNDNAGNNPADNQSGFLLLFGRGLRLPVNRRLPIDRRLLRIDRRLIIHRRLRGLVINRGAGRSRLLRRRCIR